MPSRLTLALCLALAGAAATGARAQGRDAAPADAARAAIDETALRYYAATRQLARVEAETRRLERLHPGWTQPADLWSAEPGRPDEQPFWDLFAADRMEELQRAIQARREADPDWRPSQDLAGKVERKLLRTRLLAEARRGDWEAVASLTEAIDLEATRDPELFWLAGEGLIRSKRPADALKMFQRVLETSSDPGARIATVQKGLALLPIEDAEKLIAMGRRTPDGRSEFDPIASDITRARIVATLRRQRTAEIPAAELARFAEAARRGTDPADAKLLAWYAFGRDDRAEALEWFKAAITRSGDAMTAHGLAHTLRRLSRTREAEEVAYAWREPLAQNAILFIDLLETDLTAEVPADIPYERLQRYAEVTLETQSGEGAQALAWYAHNRCQDEIALAWFERAVAWFPKEATVLGYAVLLRRMKRQREFVEVVNRYDGLFPTVVGLLFNVGDSKPPPCMAAAAPKPPPPRNAPPPSVYLELAPQPAQPADRSPTRPVGPDVARGSVVPGPMTIASPSAPELPKVKRAEFPVPTPPENPVRFPRIDPSPDPMSWRRDPPDPLPLVARRVAGVTTMPYERYGFALLPAYNGAEAASPFAVSKANPPAGTVWAEDLAAGRVRRVSGFGDEPTNRTASIGRAPTSTGWKGMGR